MWTYSINNQHIPVDMSNVVTDLDVTVYCQ